MMSLRIWIARILGWLRRERSEREFADEIRAHLDALVEEKIRLGMKPEEAQYAARREFGGVEQTREA